MKRHYWTLLFPIGMTIFVFFTVYEFVGALGVIAALLTTLIVFGVTTSEVFARILLASCIICFIIWMLAGTEHCEGSLAEYFHIGHLVDCTGP